MAKNKMSEEGRAKIAEAQKRRWAKKRGESEPGGESVPAKQDESRESAPGAPDTFEPLPVQARRADPVHPVSECTACGFVADNLTFPDVMKKHAEVRPWCKNPCIVHPSEKALKEREIKRLAAKKNRRSAA